MLRKITKIIPILALALIGAISCLTFPTFAEENNAEVPPIWLQISPVSNRITLEPKQIIDNEFTVENIGSEDFDYKIYATPYYASSGNYDLNFSIENSYTQIARWITFQNPEGNYVDTFTTTIKKGEKQVIKYRVVVPEDIPSGGQYAALFAESINKNDNQATAGIKTVSRVGLVLYANTNGETRRDADIADYHFDKFKFSGKLTAGAKISNNGNTDFNASYTYTVKTIFGKELHKDEQSYFVLPETSRDISVEWADTPFMGIFQVNYKVTASDSTEEQTSIVLVMPIFIAIIALLLLTIIAIWIIILIRKRKEHKAKLLV